MRAWLKGGLIGGIISLPLLIFSNIFYKILSKISLTVLFEILYFPRTIINYIIYSKLFNGFFYQTISMMPANHSSYQLTITGKIISLTFTLLIYFIIGAIIGFIVWIFKKRKKMVNENVK